MIVKAKKGIDLTDHRLHKGDRVLAYVRGRSALEDDGNFGRITSLGTYRVQVKLENGKQILCQYENMCYAPNDEEIEHLCREIRSGWTHVERRQRCVFGYVDQCDPEPVDIPWWTEFWTEVGRVD